MESEGVLKGVRIPDFTFALAGPFGSILLWDLGAEIIKVEHSTGRAMARIGGYLNK